MLGRDIAETAARMGVDLALAGRYEAAITRLMADLKRGTAPGATGAAPDPQQGDHA
jgi:short subunit dehydrogenase-like uncharacterized protein